MLTDKQIDKLTQPIINTQIEMEMMVLSKMAIRLNTIGLTKSKKLDTLEQTRKTDSEIRIINREINKQRRLQEKRLRKLIMLIAFIHYDEAEELYEQQKREYLPFYENREVQSLVKTMQNDIVTKYNVISNPQTLSITWRDLTSGNVTDHLSISQTFHRITDYAIRAVADGTVDYNTAIRKVIQVLVGSGLNSVTYESENGRVTHQRTDTVVRRTVLDGVRATSQAMQNEIGKQIGADGVELTAHLMSASDHEPIQGLQFTLEEFDKCQTQQDFQDVDGVQFSAIRRPIGAWNCRHFTYSIVIGLNKPTYSKKQLADMRAKNAKGYDYTDSRGKSHHLSLYECSQKQRQYEVLIRKLREGEVIASTAGNDELANLYRQRVSQKLHEYKAFSDACKLKPQYERTRI